MSKEMTAREFLETLTRMCDTYEDCKGCPFGKNKLCIRMGERSAHKPLIAMATVWRDNHPEEDKNLEKVGNGIYFDPKHRIVPDEIVRVTTIEITEVVPQGFCELIGREMTEREIAEYKHRVRDVIIENFGHDDLHINVQQFITKSHEVEV